VASIDESIQQAIVLGGTVQIGKTDHGKFFYAYIKDPTGALIALYQKK
jgi:predicted enzyme related to lactoylglutathione lyase